MSDEKSQTNNQQTKSDDETQTAWAKSFQEMMVQMMAHWQAILGVTLLVVDQRPSSIDADVMSQIGSRVTARISSSSSAQRPAGRPAGRTGPPSSRRGTARGSSSPAARST